MDDRKIITIESGKRGGKPCIRGLRIAVGDILGWPAADITREQVRHEPPDVTDEDITAALAFAGNFTNGDGECPREAAARSAAFAQACVPP